jgi:hypothetical protein
MQIELGKDLTELPGTGNDLAGKIREIVKTGSLMQLKELDLTVFSDHYDRDSSASIGKAAVHWCQKLFAANRLSLPCDDRVTDLAERIDQRLCFRGLGCIGSQF